MITLLFFWLKDVALAKERVEIRVLEGGHHIDPLVIERRYFRGIRNLFDIYLPIVDGAFLWDNSSGRPRLFAQKLIDSKLTIVDQETFEELMNQYDHG